MCEMRQSHQAACDKRLCAFDLSNMSDAISAGCRESEKIYADTVAVGGSGCWQQSALLQGRTIDIKFIYILSVSFVLSGLLGWLCVKAGILTYEEKENR